MISTRLEICQKDIFEDISKLKRYDFKSVIKMGAKWSKEKEGVYEECALKKLFYTCGAKWVKDEDKTSDQLKQNLKDVEEGTDFKGNRRENAPFAQQNYRDPRIFLQPTFENSKTIKNSDKLRQNLKEERTDFKGNRGEDFSFIQKNYRDPTKFVKPTYGNSKAIERKQISEDEMILFLSKGIVSRGFFISKDLHDSTPTGKSLITMIKDLKYIHFDIRTSVHTFDFSSKEQFQSFQKYITEFGISPATQIFHGSFSSKRENKIDRHSAFAAREDIEIIRCCRISAGDMQYQLTEEASAKLQSLEKMLLENKDHFIKECQHFFHEFGSHIYCGDYILGGIYRYTASCESEESTIKSDAESKSKVAAAINKLIQLGKFGTQDTNVSLEYEGKGENRYEKDEYNVKKEILKVGGPPELDNKDDWKRELLQQKSTWAIIDRDKLGALTYRGIWKLVIEKEGLFSDANTFAAELQRVWEKISSHRSLNEHLAKENYKQAKKKFLESQSEKNLLALKEAVESVEKHRLEMREEGIFFKTEVEESPELQEIFLTSVNGDTFDAKTKLELSSVLHPLKDIVFFEDIKSKLPPEQHFNNPYAYVLFYP